MIKLNVSLKSESSHHYASSAVAGSGYHLPTPRFIVGQERGLRFVIYTRWFSFFPQIDFHNSYPEAHPAGDFGTTYLHIARVSFVVVIFHLQSLLYPMYVCFQFLATSFLFVTKSCLNHCWELRYIKKEKKQIDFHPLSSIPMSLTFSND